MRNNEMSLYPLRAVQVHPPPRKFCGCTSKW